jgi:hypothetical protein
MQKMYLVRKFSAIPEDPFGKTERRFAAEVV